MSDEAPPIELRRGLPPGAEAQAAALYWEAFGRKLGPALGPAGAGTAFIAAQLHRDRAVVALAGGRLVGVAGYRHAGRPFVGGKAGDVRRAYGRLRGLPRIALLALLERSPGPGQLLMDGIAVDPAFRGRGIGTRLLDGVVAIAAEQGYAEVRLDVIDVNPRARALYLREGFVPVRTTQTPYLRSLLGFGAATTMRRPTANSPKMTPP